MNQRKSRKSLDKRLFYAISREVKSTLVGGSYKADDIAKAHSVSSETVRSVRRAGTWPKFVENKKARRVRQVELNTSKSPVLSQHPFVPRAAKVPPLTYVTREELDMALVGLRRDYERSEHRLDQMVTWVGKLEDRIASGKKPLYRRLFNRGRA
jgi:hypothetical protein